MSASILLLMKKMVDAKNVAFMATIYALRLLDVAMDMLSTILFIEIILELAKPKVLVILSD